MLFYMSTLLYTHAVDRLTRFCSPGGVRCSGGGAVSSAFAVGRGAAETPLVKYNERVNKIWQQGICSLMHLGYNNILLRGILLRMFHSPFSLSFFFFICSSLLSLSYLFFFHNAHYTVHSTCLMYTHTCTHARTHTHTHTCTHARTHTHTHTHAHALTHAHTLQETHFQG